MQAVEAEQVVGQTSRPLRVMIAGAPAAGKGTQCVKIVEKVGDPPPPPQIRKRC